MLFEMPQYKWRTKYVRGSVLHEDDLERIGITQLSTDSGKTTFLAKFVLSNLMAEDIEEEDSRTTMRAVALLKTTGNAYGIFVQVSEMGS